MTEKKKTAAEQDLETMLEFSEQVNFESILASHHPMNVENLIFQQLIAGFDEKGRQYLDWVIYQSHIDFYIPFISPDGSILMVRRPHLKAYLGIRYGYPGDNAAAVIGKERTIQIENIGSFIKGEGYKIMKKVIRLGKKIDCTIELWTETEENVKYFERYGFKNHGRLGKYGEFLMVLTP